MVDLCQILEETLVSFYGMFTQRRLSPQVLTPEVPVERYLDPVAVISNALKYSDGDFAMKMNASGTIIFSNKAKRLNPFSVERLFNRFYTVETGRNSTSLGLSIEKMLTEKMGGSIDAEYRDGTLYITIIYIV